MFLLLISAGCTGSNACNTDCTGNGPVGHDNADDTGTGDSGDTDGIGDSADDSDTDDSACCPDDSGAATTLTVNATLLGVREGMTVNVYDDKGEFVADGNSGSAIPLESGADYTIRLGGRETTDRDGNPLYVRESDSSRWYSPPQTVALDGGTNTLDLAVHRHYDGTATCINNAWWYDEDAPDHKGVQDGVNEEHDPVDVQVEGDAVYGDEEAEDAMHGASLLVNGRSSGDMVVSDADAWVVVGDQLYINGDGSEITGSVLGNTSISFSSVRQDVVVYEVTCEVEPYEN